MDATIEAPAAAGMQATLSQTPVRAAVLRKHRAPLTLETLMLRPPGPGEVRVQIAACAICHSDLSAADGIWGGAVPVVLGHEAAGTVEAVGEGVGRVAIGDRVVVTLIRSCQSCECCAQGQEVQCEHRADPGSPLTDEAGDPVGQGMDTGAFAEAVLVHESQMAPIPDELPFDLASLLGCGVLTGFGAVANVAEVKAGQSVAVIGCGGVGLNAVQAARLAGAGSVVALDPSPERREQALALGATHAFDPTDTAGMEVARTVLGRGADAAFVAAGHVDAMTDAATLLAPRGQLVILGMPPVGALASYEPVTLAYYGHRIVGTRMGDAVVARDVPRLAQLYLNGGLELDALVGGRWPLERIEEAFEAARRGEGARQVVVMGD